MREILVFGDKTFKIRVPDYAKLTFGPFSPPPRGRNAGIGEWSEAKAVGTLRVYGRTQKDILGVFTGVRGFRDLSLEYAEEVAREEGAVLWKSDEHGYTREEKIKRATDFVEHKALPPAPERKRRGR